LNHFGTNVDPCVHRWGLAKTSACECGQLQPPTVILGKDLIFVKIKLRLEIKLINICEVQFDMFSESNRLTNLVSINKQPRMSIRLAAPTKEQKELLELVLFTSWYISC